LILVTGATGYVGSAVGAGCCRKAWRSLQWSAIRAPQASERLPPQVTLCVADYEDSSASRSALTGADQMILIS
jgi:NAD(P)H dehydrogenase (quinone)